MTANEIDIRVTELMRDFDIRKNWDHFELVGEGQKRELIDKNDRSNRYYQWLSCLMQLVKPQQIVELGAAGGISTTVMALEMPKDGKLYSVDIDPKIAWIWMKYNYPQVVKILGNDLDMSIWPKDVDLGKTDVWFFDSLHTTEQLTKELELYTPFFKKGAILVFDDIRMPELWPVWEALPYDKRETSNPNHWSGFGHAVV